ncbi:MAG: diguanylate cyclase [Campylobacterales bacterium]|nr:diguanylate cyclase [Campylobacterales bacterium]
MPWLADTFAFAALCVWGWRVGGSVFGAFFLFTAFPHVTLEASLASLTHLGALMGGALFVFSFGKRAQSSLFERIVFFGLGSFISAFLLSINASLEEISLTWTGTLSLPLFLPHLAQFLLSFFVVLLLQRGFVSSTRHFEPNLSFEHLFQNLPIPVAYKDTKGVYQGCNRAFTVLIGSAKTEVIKHLQSLPPKHTQHTHLPYDNNVLKEVHLTCEKVTNDTGVLLGSVCLLVDITEFETLKKRLQYWKERYELALDGANDGLWDWDVVNDTVFFSRRWKEIMGYKPHENPNHVDHWLGLIGDADSKHVTSELRAHLKGSSPVFEVEHQCVHLDNAVRWVKVQGKALFDSTHKPVRMVGYVSDITQTKKAQHALKESQELFLRFMNALPALAFIRNTEGAFTYMNASYEKFIGGKEWREKKADAIFPQSVATLLQNQDRLTLYEGIGQHEQRFPDVLGKEHIFQSFNFPFQDAKGARMLGGIALDITKERLLEERTKLFANIFETTSEGIMVTDSAGKIVTINHAFTLLTGFTAADVLGKNPRIRKSGHHDKAFYEALWKTLLETGAWKGELYNLHNDGEVVPERLSISTIKNERGEVAYFVGIFTNISEQKAQEKRLEALAHYDTLTGIPSRFLFLDRLDQCIANTLRTQKKAALLFIDLDDFKPINDTYGHEAGDEVLKTIATRLSAQIRRSDTVARLAGDEFVVLLTNLTSGADLRMLCSKILATIQEPILFKTETLRVGASIGICVCPDHGDTVEALLRHADEAMYQVKKQGKRAMGIYKPSTKTH